VAIRSPFFSFSAFQHFSFYSPGLITGLALCAIGAVAWGIVRLFQWLFA
jgi:hypothetical protein